MAKTTLGGIEIEIDEDGFIQEPDKWNKDVAEDLAKVEEAYPMGEDHWKLVNYLRDYYIKYEIAPPVRMLVKQTGLDLKKIYQLFPGGPAKGACKVAGLPKPTGDWLQVKDRCLLGSGSGNPACVVFPKQEVGIDGDFESYAVPRSFGTFSRRVPYFHEGLSLQECVLPVIAVRLKKEAGPAPAGFEVQISYKAGKTSQVTTRLPLVDLSVFSEDMFEAGEIELRLEAWGKDAATGQERVIGEPASSDHVHPATGLVRVKPGQAIKVPIRLEEGFSGAFEVRVYDPETRLAYGEPLRLKTHILE